MLPKNQQRFALKSIAQNFLTTGCAASIWIICCGNVQGVTGRIFISILLSCTQYHGTQFGAWIATGGKTSSFLFLIMGKASGFISLVYGVVPYKHQMVSTFFLAWLSLGLTDSTDPGFSPQFCFLSDGSSRCGSKALKTLLYLLPPWIQNMDGIT